MKKIVMIAMFLLLAVGMSLSVFAGPGGFVSSPSAKIAPTLEEVVPEDEECTAQVVITGYGNRSNLSEENRLLIEAAYTSIVGASSLSDINADLASLAEIGEVSIDEFAISDLFDVTRADCEGHENHGSLTLTIKVADPIENLVCLLHYTGNAWEIVSGELSEDGMTITFTGTDFSPYAIVVSNVELAEEADSNWGWIIALVTGGTASLGGGGWYFLTQTQTGAKVLAAIFKKKKA